MSTTVEQATETPQAEMERLEREHDELQATWQRERFAGLVLPVLSQPGGDPRRFERKCQVAIEIDWRSARLAELRLAQAEADLAAAQDADLDALAQAVVVATAHRREAEAVAVEARRAEAWAKNAAHQHREQVQQLSAAVEGHRYDVQRWTDELAKDQERLAEARQRIALREANPT